MFKNKILMQISLILLTISIPILINYLLLTWKAPGVYGNADSWLGFLANYSGGIIGGVVAYIVANSQIRTQIDFDRQKTMEINRSYAIVQDFTGPFKLHNIETSYKSRIILTNDYDQVTKALSKDQLKELRTSFYKITHHGTPDIILNCNIKIFLKNEQGEDLPVIESHLGVIEKEEEVFIPLYIKGEKQVFPRKAELLYTTVSGERMFYLYDVENGKEGYWLINNNDKEKIFEFELKNSNWIYPNRIK
jgi:hypothetical protein